MLSLALALGWIWGDRFEARGAVADTAVAERDARAYLAGVIPPGTELAVLENRLDDGLRTVTFQQTWRGLPIVGAEAGVVISRDRVLAARSTAIAEPRIVARGGSGHVILPIDGRLELADAIDDGADTIFVASDGNFLTRTTRLRTASGALAFDVGVRRPGGERRQLPAPGIDIGGAVTAADGTFACDAPTTIAVTPTGLVNLVNHGGTLAAGSLAASPGSTSVWSLAADELGDAQLATYVYATIVEAKDVQIEPSFAAYVANPVFFYVNETSPCNAFSTGDDVHFAVAGDGCENTGRLADVVFHEFGHTFHFHTFIRGMGAFDPALSEGLADYNAINLTGDGGVGRGFFGDDEPLRDLTRVRRWPDDISLDPHVTGEIVAGALWDLRQAIGADATERVFHGLILRAPDIPGSYLAAKIADDDDGDLTNGTPHGCAIDRVFAAHGLAPDVATIDAGSPVTDGASITIPIVRRGTVDPACPPLEVGAIEVAWRAGSTSGTIALAQDGDAWTAALPDLPAGTIVAYTVAITRADGVRVVRPDNPADPAYQALIGAPTPIWCASMDADPQWTLHGFSYGPPDATDDGAGNPHAAFTGTDVIGMGGFYGASARSLAETPPIDVPAHGSVHLQFRRWLTVQDAAFDRAAIEVNGQTVWTNATGPHQTLDHLDREWRLVDLDVSDAARAGSLRIRWSLASNDDFIGYGGWNLDDVCVVALDAPAEVHTGGGCAAAPAGWLAMLAIVPALNRRRRRSELRQLDGAGARTTRPSR